MELVKEINETFGIDLQTTDIFDYGCIKDLAKYIVENFRDKLKIAKEIFISTIYLKNKKI